MHDSQEPQLQLTIAFFFLSILFILRDVNGYWSTMSRHKINHNFRKIKKRKFIYRIINEFQKKNLKKIYYVQNIWFCGFNTCLEQRVSGNGTVSFYMWDL
jgi:hypothetical protein